MKRRDVFEVLEPPPFGLERLRARLDARRSMAPRLVVLATVVATVLAVVLWPRNQVVTLTLPTLVGDVAPLDPATTAVQPLPSSNPDVVLVRVLALDGAAAEAL